MEAETWYDIAMKHVVEQTWTYRCCSWDLCSKRFHRFVVRKYVESMKSDTASDAENGSMIITIV